MSLGALGDTRRAGVVLSIAVIIGEEVQQQLLFDGGSFLLTGTRSVNFNSICSRFINLRQEHPNGFFVAVWRSES